MATREGHACRSDGVSSSRVWEEDEEVGTVATRSAAVAVAVAAVVVAVAVSVAMSVFTVCRGAAGAEKGSRIGWRRGEARDRDVRGNEACSNEGGAAVAGV